MRRIVAGLTGLAAVLAGTGMAVAPAGPARAATVATAPTEAAVATVPDPTAVAGDIAETTRTVGYRGYQVRVPVSWRVVDLAARPHACLRFDRPTVYLGHPGDQAECPARLVGRTAGLLVEPFDGASASRHTPPAAGTATVSAPVSRDDAIQVAVRDAGVRVTAVHTPLTEPLVRRILDTATLGPDASPAPSDLPAGPGAAAGTPSSSALSEAAVGAPPPAPAGPAPGVQGPAAPLAAAGPQPGTYLGRGFDTCTAPSQSAMDAWRASSPYRAVGIYISGANRSCAQPNLTASWVGNQTANGWRLIPIELGRQAPCSTRYTLLISSDQATARAQGATAATNAVGSAQALGIPAGSAIYNDIEHYPSNPTCRAAVLSFLSGWTERLHALGYLSGMYSSGSSGIADVASAYHDPAYTRVDHLWFAWWNGAADTDAGPYAPAGYWADHQRLHQYAGDVYETWGGVQIRIDRNYLDVAAGSAGPPPVWSSVVDNDTAGRFTASANWGTSAYSAQRHGADYRFADPVLASDVAWWRVNIPQTASYEVSVWYAANPDYNDSTPFIVVTTTGNRTVRVNQRAGGGRWVSLGVFTLPAGDGDRIGVSRWTSGTGYVIADAVRVTRV
ncbi:glycoside hydrolase domain-containing protein [Plantactinospora sp. WMMB334]|uniref:glycoside hydrolase domain-containing protein n=1 Tax=Plantactinospora sp. WMMB334 TaxID=3404119 RepID=UPI003B95D8FB